MAYTPNVCPANLTKDEIVDAYSNGIPKVCDGCPNFQYEDGIAGCSITIEE